jgi:predicted dehydrogenase
MGQLAHLYSFSRAPGCEIVALAEARPELARQVRARYAIPSVYGSHEELLADDGVDAVVASQPFHRNYYFGRELLEAGKHLFTEKPMAGTLQDARELVTLAEEGNLVYAVGFMKRHDPGVLAAKQILEELEQTGELGSLGMVDTTCFLGDWLQNPGQPIRTDEPLPVDNLAPRYPDHLSTPMHPVYDHFLNVYSHNINLIRFLLPERPVVCESAQRSGESFLVALRSGDTIVSVRGTPVRSHRWEEQTTFHFEKGRVEIQSATPMNRQKVADVAIWRESRGTWTEERLFVPVEWAFYRQAAAYVEAVAGGAGLSTSGRQCLADVALMEDIFKKLRQEHG